MSLLLQTREEVFGKEGWGGEQVQTMLDVSPRLHRQASCQAGEHVGGT